ncbi:MAG: hypothetical protein ACRD2W_22890 [Acidimicrobiales bacterium]
MRVGERWRRMAGPACLALVLAAVPVAAAAAQTHTEAPLDAGALELLGHTDLGGKGVNGDVAVVGNTAIVGAGTVTHTGYHTERYNPGPCLEVTAKVVDLTDPGAPRVASTIPIPVGVAAIDVDALSVRTPSFTGVLAAIALDDGPSQSGPSSCTAPNVNPMFVDRGIIYYNITNPSAPEFLGRYMADQGPMDDVASNALPCGPPPDRAAVRCATGQHSVDLVQRADGRVLSISVEPIADFLTKPSGDVRVVDVTDPKAPSQLGAWPPLGERPGSFSPNGCGPFSHSHSAEFYDGGNKALVSFMDAGLFDLNTGVGNALSKASQFAYPDTRAEEGNAGYATATVVDGQTVALLSEEGWWPTNTRLRIDAPSSLAGEKYACQGLPTIFDQTSQSPLWKRPNATIAAEIVYGGRGCPARGTAANPTPEDPWPVDPRGKIVLLDSSKVNATQPDIPQQACNNTTRMNRAQQAGALAVLFGRVQLAPFNASPQGVGWGGDWKNLSIPGISVDEGDANAMRTTLCPRLVDGLCNGGTPITGSVVDQPGAWGGLRILEVDPDTGMRQLALIRSPHGTTFPPPDLGVYAPGRAVADGEKAYVAWHSDGLRVIDLGESPPKEVAHFVPADSADPSGSLPAKASVIGVALAGGNRVVITDQNSGLYVLAEARNTGGGGSVALYLALVLGGVAVLVAGGVLVARRRSTVDA